MKIVTGIDLVYIPRFRAVLKQDGEKFLQRVYLREELSDQGVQHLAGIFAAKEAIMKALDLSKNSWHSIIIKNKQNGAPFVEIGDYEGKIKSSSLSIAHDKAYVIAQFVALLVLC